MRQTTTIALLVILLGLFTSVRGKDRTDFIVTYLSAEHVYIDGGAEDGLRIGQTLALVSSRLTPVLEVVYVSGHSASCRPLPNAPTFAVGARLLLVPSLNDDRTGARAVTTPPADSLSPQMPPAIRVELGSTPRPIRLSGTMSFGFYRLADAAPADLDFSQTNAHLRLKVEHLWNEHVTLVLRTRGRYDSRQRASADLGRNDWENRLWELSLSYDNPDSPFSFSAGRILPRRLPASGYLDGAVTEWRPSGKLTVGLLAGQQPDWAYRLDDASVSRFGGYLSWGRRTMALSGVEQSLGVIAETHSGTANRTYLAAQGRLGERRWGISHSAEFDINTGWRKERAGESVALSRAFIHAFWQATRLVRIGFSYDNLRRYWTWEYRTLADSLFDDRTRQGVRARVDWSASPNWRLSFGGGLRDQPDDADPTISYSARVRRSRLLARDLSASVYLNGFDGDRERGVNYALQFDALINPLGLVHLRYGQYRYAVQSVDSDRSSWSVETGLDTDIARHYFLSGLVQYNSGDDIDGWRLQADAGYRF